MHVHAGCHLPRDDAHVVVDVVRRGRAAQSPFVRGAVRDRVTVGLVSDQKPVGHHFFAREDVEALHPHAADLLPAHVALECAIAEQRGGVFLHRVGGGGGMRQEIGQISTENKTAVALTASSVWLRPLRGLHTIKRSTPAFTSLCPRTRAILPSYRFSGQIDCTTRLGA